MNKSNRLYWKTATEPAEHIEVRLVLNSYADNDNLYVGLEKHPGGNPELWEAYTDITINCNSLPPFYAYVDSRDCNKYAPDFLVHNRIAEPTGLEYHGFRMFRFDPERLKELVLEQFKSISKSLPPQNEAVRDLTYRDRQFPLRTVEDTHGIYLISTKELEEALLESVQKPDITANGLLDSISLFCPEQDLRHLTDKELMDAIHSRIL